MIKLSNRTVGFVCVVLEPSEVKLHVDGSTDKCSKGEDINFLFTGFTIHGQVLLKLPSTEILIFLIIELSPGISRNKYII